MKRIILCFFALLLVFPTFSQKKKVAVVTFYVNKYIEPGSGLSADASTAASIGALAKSPDFNLSSMLDTFHTAVFGDYLKDFPFDVADEKYVLENEAYKNFQSFDTASILFNNNLLYKGYRYCDVNMFYKKDLEKLMETFKDVDGYLFVFLSYTVVAKSSYAGMGKAGVSANINMKLWNKAGERVFNIYESSVSGGSVALVGGFPIMKTAKILPLCQDATKKLLVEFKGRLPKIIKKVGKKL